MPILRRCAEAGPDLPALRNEKAPLLLFPELLDHVSGRVVRAVISRCGRGTARSDPNPASPHVWAQSCVAGAPGAELATGISLQEAQISFWTQCWGSLEDPGDAPTPRAAGTHL